MSEYLIESKGSASMPITAEVARLVWDMQQVIEIAKTIGPVVSQEKYQDLYAALAVLEDAPISAQAGQLTEDMQRVIEIAKTIGPFLSKTQYQELQAALAVLEDEPIRMNKRLRQRQETSLFARRPQSFAEVGVT